jgi:hypothetical protein
MSSIVKEQDKRFVFLKVTTSTLYMFEEGSINGWTTAEVIEDWFEHFSPNAHHASRDAHQVAYTTVVERIETLRRKGLDFHIERVKATEKNIAEKRKKKEETKKVPIIVRKRIVFPSRGV